MPNLAACAAAAALLLLLGALPAAAADTAADTAATAAHAPYGERATYRVTRGGAPAGVHRLRFAGDAARLTVHAETRATMRVFGIFNVPFIYDSRAVWEDGELLTLSSSFSGAGDGAFWLRREGDSYRTQSGASAAAPLLPTNHWHSAALRQRVLYNTLNGKLSSVRIRRRGEEQLAIGGVQTPATRYDVSGDLEISLWYGAGGKWLQLQFQSLGGDYLFTYQPDGE